MIEEHEERRSRNVVGEYVVLMSREDAGSGTWIRVGDTFEAKNRAEARGLAHASAKIDTAQYVAIRASEFEPKSPKVKQPPPIITWE